MTDEKQAHRPIVRAPVSPPTGRLRSYDGDMSGNKKWSDLSSGQRKALLAGMAVELVLTTWAARDLLRRPAASVRGPKALWGASFAVQPFGPLAYLAFGRR